MHLPEESFLLWRNLSSTLMALMQLHRSRLASTSSSRFCPIRVMLKYRTFQSHFDAYPMGSRPGFQKAKCSHIRFAKVRVSEKMAAPPLTAVRVDFPLRSSLSVAPIYSSRKEMSNRFPSKFCFVNSMSPVLISSFMPFGDSVIFGLSCVGAALRSFSTNAISRPQAVHDFQPSFEKRTNSKKGDGKHRCSNKLGNRVKASAVENGCVPALVSNSAKNINSCEALVDHGDIKPLSTHSSTDGQESSLKLKPKKQSRGKKKKKDLSSTSDVGSSKTSENGFTKSTDGEVVDSANTTKPLPKKKTTNSKKKGVSQKGATNGALLETKKNVQLNRGDSLQKHKPKETGKSNQQGGKSLKPLYPPAGKSVVVVESVTKAKVIQGYLGNMYEVIPSYGHIRDLAARSGSVRPDDDFSMVWEVPSLAWTHLKGIKLAVSGADNLILASDPDREGEAIAWHIIEMLQQQDALREDLTIARVVFHEITEEAIKSALHSPRDLDDNLVRAYLARRALDYLIGFNISPLLWRKLPGCQSAGRVQSAALALICDREMEIDAFNPQEYWSVEALFSPENLETSERNYLVPAHLTHFDSKKLNQLSVGSELEAKNIEQTLTSSEFKVIGIKRSKLNKNPPTPYITSTLQQDAANKLNFSATYTMKLAQKLYEGVQLSDGNSTGLITYMRTDGVHISNGAAQDIRSLIVERYGERFASSSPRKYFKKVKNAQEAHEAIRPTDIRRLPSMIVDMLDEDSLNLYALIWSRTLACQMEPATIAQLQVNIGNIEESIAFRASCSRVEFPGYRAVYEDVESKALRGQDNEKDDREKSFEFFSDLNSGDVMQLSKVELKQHHTQPPPRYSEASLVKKLEELGIGRPSTYATTIKVLQDRKYVTVKNRVLYPEFRGRMVSAFLMHYFSEVMDYSFTADMETELDNISAGLTEWKGLLNDYWTRFSSYCERASKLHIHQVERMLERTFQDFLFASLPDQSRNCPSCLDGILIFKVSKYGAGYFIGCDQHPSCKYIAKTLYGEEEDDDDGAEKSSSVEEPKLLGLHPVSNLKVFLKNGPYGSYVQLGEDRKGSIPKRSSVSQIKDVNSITLEDALELLRYPLTLGYHPDDGQPVVLKLARVGFTIRYRRHIAPVPKTQNPSDITMEKALDLLAGKNVRKSGRPKKKPQPREEDEAVES